MKWRMVVVDDEVSAVQEMTFLLEQTGQVAELRQVNRASEVLDLVNMFRPDVIFLDIDMPEISGIRLAEQLQQQPDAGSVVFVTSHRQYALQAFDLSALDYLLKPVHPRRLAETLERLQQVRKPNGPPVQAEARPAADIRCFGEFQVHGPNGLARFKTSKSEELFAYFLIHRKTTMKRMIRDVFPDTDEEHAVNYVHNSIFQIRQAVKSAGLEQQVRLNYVNRSYELVIEGLLTDMERFAMADDPEERVQLYRGGALAHFYTDWTLSVSDTYQIQYAEALRQSVLKADQRGDPQAVKLYQHRLSMLMEEPPE